MARRTRHFKLSRKPINTDKTIARKVKDQRRMDQLRNFIGVQS